MAKRGRPEKYTQALADKLCEGLSNGYSLRTVCAPEDMPSKALVFQWMRTKPEFLDQYARAKQEASDAMADEILDISDDGSNDWMDVEFGNGKTKRVIDNEALQRSRLRVDTRKWLMAKMKPKKYGDKIDVVSDGKAIKGNQIIFTDFKADEAGSE